MADPNRIDPTNKEKHRIGLQKAKEMIQRHRSGGGGLGNLRAAAWGRGILDEILAQPGCAGVRIYFGRKEDGSTTLLAVGMDADGNDLTGGTIADDIWPCPPFCSGGGGGGGLEG